MIRVQYHNLQNRTFSMQGYEDSLPPPATSSAAERSRRSCSAASSRSRSRTTSQPGSRSGSQPPPTEPMPSTSRLNASVITSNLPAKRERSESADVDRIGPSSSLSQIEDDFDGPPSLKRMRLQTDSIDDVNKMLTTNTAYSSFDAGLPSTTGASSSHEHEGDALRRRDSVQSREPNAIDVDTLHDGDIHAARPREEVADAPGQDNSRNGPSRAPSKMRSPCEPLSSYTCPICFCSPTYATLTPCGHICCGECLFTAVKATIERSQFHGPASQNAK